MPKSKSRKTSKRFVVNEERGLAECRGKKKIVCFSDPNCSYRRRIGCVRRKIKYHGELFYGPILSNIFPYGKRKSKRKSKKSKRKSK